MRAPAVAIAVLVAVTAFAEPRVAHAYRPFDQTDADSAELETIELEIGPLTILHGTRQTVYEPGGVFNYGFARGWELVVDYSAAIPLGDPSSTLVLTDVMVKHVLRAGSLQGGTGPSLALEAGALLPTLPTLDDEVGGSADLIVSQHWEPVTIHVNGLVEYRRDRAYAETLDVIVEGPAAWRVRPVAEGYISRELGAEAYSGLGGAIWNYREHLTFDAAVRIGRDEGVTSGELRIGLTWVIPT